LTDYEAAARGQRAKQAAEFVGPILASHRSEYLDKIALIATTELDAKKRADAITSLSVAMKILGNIESALTAAIQDGDMAEKSIIRADNVAKMSDHKRRLFEFAPQR